MCLSEGDVHGASLFPPKGAKIRPGPALVGGVREQHSLAYSTLVSLSRPEPGRIRDTGVAIGVAKIVRLVGRGGCHLGDLVTNRGQQPP